MKKKKVKNFLVSCSLYNNFALFNWFFIIINQATSLQMMKAGIQVFSTEVFSVQDIFIFAHIVILFDYYIIVYYPKLDNW